MCRKHFHFHHYDNNNNNKCVYICLVHTYTFECCAPPAWLILRGNFSSFSHSYCFVILAEIIHELTKVRISTYVFTSMACITFIIMVNTTYAMYVALEVFVFLLVCHWI